MRCDLYLSENGYAKSRSRARELIEAGHVSINGRIVRKPSEFVDELAEIQVEISCEMPFVSRGGLKLDHALNTFCLSVEGLCALDIGASTGGFTDCLLKRGAARVIAVDSGENQLDPSLREDTRVICVEKYNARYMKAEDFDLIPDMAVIDVSFISQTLILPSLSTVMKEGATVVSLIKPQFEVGRSAVGKKGIVKNSRDRRNAIESVIACAAEHDLGCFGLTRSPIAGGDGNIEFLAAFRKGAPTTVNSVTINEIAEG